VTGINPVASAHIELAETLKRTEAALESGDLAAANEGMMLAVDLCRRLHQAGVPLSPPCADEVKDLVERCGQALVRVGDRVNQESFRDENHRRGILSYEGVGRR